MKNGNVIWKNILGTIGLVVVLLGILAAVIEGNLSTKYTFKELRKDINTMDININKKIDTKTSDRWRKSSDKRFMEKYSHVNNLKMIDHENIID